jgi:streptogramin lyase
LIKVDEQTASRETIVRLPSDIAGQHIAVGYRTVWITGLSGSGADTLIRLDPATAAPLPATDVAPSGGLAIGEGAVWVPVSGGNVDRIDGATHKVVKEIGLRTTQGADAVAAGDGAVWVLSQVEGKVWRIDPRTNEVVKAISVNGNPSDIAVGEGAAWILDDVAGTVTPIDEQTNSPGAPIRVGQNPSGIAAGLGAVWVTDQTEGTMYKINPTTRRTSRIRIGKPLSGVAVDKQTRTVWATVTSGG